MRTEQRLTQAYREAHVVYFDDSSKFILFSDSHRGDNTLSDEFAKNRNIFLYALEYYYYNDFTYIEVGDGDELWEYGKFRYIRYAHSDVFQAIKKFFDEKRLIMLYGNHNMRLKNKAWVRNNLYFYRDEYYEEERELLKNIIPYESVVLSHRETCQEILVLHGHQGDLMNDQLWFISYLLMRFFWRFVHVVGFRNPASPAKNHLKRHKIERMYNKWIKNQKTMLICGHTHRDKYPQEGELPYFNTGSCVRAKGITGMEISDGKILLVEWLTKADHEGTLRITRRVVRGPEPLSKFDMMREQYCQYGPGRETHEEQAPIGD